MSTAWAAIAFAIDAYLVAGVARWSQLVEAPIFNRTATGFSDRALEEPAVHTVERRGERVTS
jgi:hypothetical protein